MQKTRSFSIQGVPDEGGEKMKVMNLPLTRSVHPDLVKFKGILGSDINDYVLLKNIFFFQSTFRVFTARLCMMMEA